MIKLKSSCELAFELKYKNNKECKNIINDILNIDTPVDIICDKLIFEKRRKNKNSNMLVLRGVFYCKIRVVRCLGEIIINNNIIIIRETDKKLYLVQSNGDKHEIINNKLEAMDIYRYFETEIEMFKNDIKRALFGN